MALRGIVFDLDGTLVDSLGATFEAFNHGIMKFGGKKHTPREIMHYFGTHETGVFAKIIGEENAGAAKEAFKTYLFTNAGNMPLFPEVPELLDELDERKIPYSIFTGRGWDTTQTILNHHGIHDRFVTVVSSDHVTKPKPSAEGLHLVLSRMKMKPSEVLFVGDSPVDIIAAHEAGSIGVAALWDLMASHEELTAQKPHHFAKAPSEVSKIFHSR